LQEDFTDRVGVQCEIACSILVGDGEQQRRHGEAEHAGGLVVDVDCMTGKSAGLVPLRMRPV